MEWKFFDTDVAYVSTFEFHKDRERAPHIDQPTHQNRLHAAERFALSAERESDTIMRFVDLGCGDGGLVALLRQNELRAYGYDFQPSNEAGWVERGVRDVCARLNFVENWPHVMDADVYIITECLEHLQDPHAMVRNIHSRGAQIIASSPAKEHAGSHDECHAWGWDMDGYAKLMTDAGFVIREHVMDAFGGMFQVIWAVPA
jgi:2-polyprenyl-3-methyl-5-hydroxy-6-metoxy-1,4-benzoquinol methylase